RLSRNTCPSQQHSTDHVNGWASRTRHVPEAGQTDGVLADKMRRSNGPCYVDVGRLLQDPRDALVACL
ncbi:hypothetical protein E4U43_008448, partial [Claviceps pusilla]